MKSVISIFNFKGRNLINEAHKFNSHRHCGITRFSRELFYFKQ